MELVKSLVTNWLANKCGEQVGYRLKHSLFQVPQCFENQDVELGAFKQAILQGVTVVRHQF